MLSEEESPIQNEAKRPKVAMPSSLNFGAGGDDDDDDDFQGRLFLSQLADWLMFSLEAFS